MRELLKVKDRHKRELIFLNASKSSVITMKKIKIKWHIGIISVENYKRQPSSEWFIIKK